MADSFFNFSPRKGENRLTLEDDGEGLDNEEEYDAHNDETFGDLEDEEVLEDWEQAHEEFAGTKKPPPLELEKVVNELLKDLDLDSILPLSLTKNSVWSYTPPQKKNGDVSILSSLQEASKSFIETRVEKPQYEYFKPMHHSPAHAKKICTVEELEKNLIKHVKNEPPPPNFRPMMPNQPRPPMYPHPMFAPHLMPHFAPNMPPMNVPPPMRGMPPPGYRMMPPHPFLQANGPPRPPPGMQYPYQVPQMMPPRPNQMNFSHPNHQHQRQRHDSNLYRDNFYKENRDEYEGLMTTREKQWLTNIQLLQLNTGTPYFDDYYFTIFKEKRARSNKENNPSDWPKYHNNRQRRNSDRQENPLQPRVYTPLQFENSLGKLQCSSVIAPRKIIDMDVVSHEKDAEAPSASRDSRKTKQLLLELEAFFTLLLKAEDLTNPLAINNLKTLRDIKQKQRLKELEAAETSEQKQEILELFKKESEPVVENPKDFISKILTGLLQDDKFNSFFNIRKGKMLILRLLPHLMNEVFYHQAVELWSRILLSLPIVGRRDTAGDNILPKFYKPFKWYMQSAKMSDILDNVSGLVEIIKPESNRSTPISHLGRAPLYFVLLNKFGISAISALIIRSEYLLSVGGVSESQRWFDFLATVSDLLGQVTKVPVPIEPIPEPILRKHCDRGLSPERSASLTKHFLLAD